MRTAITLQRLHGETAFQVIAGPEVPVEQHKVAAKGIARLGREHPEIAEVQIWTSDSGCVKRLRFSKPQPAAESEPAPAEPADEQLQKTSDKPTHKPKSKK